MSPLLLIPIPVTRRHPFRQLELSIRHTFLSHRSWMLKENAWEPANPCQSISISAKMSDA